MARQVDQGIDRAGWLTRDAAQRRLQAVAVPSRDVVAHRGGRALHGVHAALRALQPLQSVARAGQYAVQLTQALAQRVVVFRAVFAVDQRRAEERRRFGPEVREGWQITIQAREGVLEREPRFDDRVGSSCLHALTELRNHERELGVSGHGRRALQGVQRRAHFDLRCARIGEHLHPPCDLAGQQATQLERRKTHRAGPSPGGSNASSGPSSSRSASGSSAARALNPSRERAVFCS